MASRIEAFERIARQAHKHTDAPASSSTLQHVFEDRNIHSDLPAVVRRLFDDGHYSQSTFEAMKFLDEEVQRVSGESDFGKSLMMRVFGGTPPRLGLNAGATTTDESEQEGYKFIFAGAMAAIRNPRGHKSSVQDDLDTCLDHLSFCSMLLRRLEIAGLR